ncbi:MAG: LysR family transcriptional regulator [Deltaproteobacteria bacterium]|nr:LysR family transcriptional regulator [Deltaproteobacteria bacterium]MBW2534593.1 LysR family transcriptional regulator [Deltaproteobacteria bacterium]
MFVKVVDAGSFTGAARLLGLPRSTVSRRVARLEQRLGSRLLHRTTRRLGLTDLGTSYYERSAEGLERLEEAQALARAAQAEPRGQLRVTAPYDLGGHLATAVAEFVKAHPLVSIEAHLTQRMVDLVAEGFDIALRATSSLPDSSLIARPVAGGEGQLFASPDYVRAHGSPTEPEELIDHTCIVLGPSRGATTWRLQGPSGPVDVRLRGRLHTNEPTFARDAAASGAGIAYLPAFIAAAAARSGALHRVLPDYRSVESRLYVVYPTAQHLSAVVRTFRDHLLTHLGTVGSFGH